ncbi:MAG: glycosyltransferase family 2 protein, partial [Acidimicrobiales bacterium]|nr:glycosyltransferase family 2 protein [Acidimicrobiales bacterium]
MLISVVTVVKHEVAQLRQLIRGVDAQSRAVDELVIVALGRVGVQAEAELASTPVTILHDPPAGYRPGAVATARAEGASIAVGELLVFLDADLVPCRDLVARYVAAATPSFDEPPSALFVGPIVDTTPDGPTTPEGRTTPEGNAAALRSVWEQIRARPDDPEVRLVEGALAHRQRRRCTGQSAWWEPPTMTRPLLGIDGTAM